MTQSRPRPRGDETSKPDEQRSFEPHPVLADFYAQRAQRSAFVRRLFNETASHYDGINRFFSFGSGAWYRRRCLLRAGLRPGHRVVDVAVGTGLLAQEALAITGAPQDVIGVDLSEAMLATARRKLDIPLIQGLAEELPLAEASADFVTMGYALRHVSDLVTAFREFNRVLRRGGTVLLLEIGRPSGGLSRALMSAYLGRLVPFLSRYAAGAPTKQLLRYYWETIENCVAPEIILSAMKEGGFRDARCTADIGIFRSYVARKP